MFLSKILYQNQLMIAMEEVVVLYPTPAIGHFRSMVELGKLILTQKPSLSIFILLATSPYNSGSISSYISNVSSTIPSIHFHHLPTTTPTSSAAANHETLMFDVIHQNKPHVHQHLVSISKTHVINAFILDFFCASSLSVASELNIPSFFFYTSGASSLASFLFIPTLHENTTKSFKDLEHFLDIPGIPPLKGSDMPKPLLDRTDKAYEYFVQASGFFPNSSGIIVNTFECLESRTLKAISDGLCVPNKITPPVYCIGPLIIPNKDERNGGSSPECLTWLDLQPSRSVVFLCFGSLGLFSMEQIREIAVGLEKSGQRFLWVVRNPPSDNHNLAISSQTDPDLDSLLPDGFLNRTKDRGFVVKTWAPQVAILSHDSVGGFVTHCGWNSVLEAVCAGIPMVAWPLYAEQRMNKVFLVKEMKIALPMDESEGGFVTALEVEKRVTELMGSESGNSVREQTIAMKNAAKEALSEGGSSRVALNRLTESWTKRNGVN